MAVKLFSGHPSLQKCFHANYWRWRQIIDKSKTGDADGALIVIEPPRAQCEPDDKEHKQTSALFRREAMAGALR